MLPTLSKTLDPADYAHFPDELARIGHAKNIFNMHLYEAGHPHRDWEYSIALAALGPREAIPGKRVIDLGGGPSFLGGIIAWGGAEVIVNDISDYKDKQEEIARRATDPANSAVPGGSLRFIQGDAARLWRTDHFDAVLCISVIEHVEKDEELFQHLCEMVLPGGVLVLTTDFHHSGQAQLTAHNRCYNGEMLNKWAATPGFVSEGGTDYADRGGNIFEKYNFASLVLRRK
jgi:2-polyprenyl-3-methyl-5-hydroxy-6-metoxy-1,4-benzoquinol methylase